MNFFDRLRRTPSPKERYVEGDLISVFDSGAFRIAKVLAVEDDSVYLRVYGRGFEEPPESVDPNNLVSEESVKLDSYGVVDLPLSKRAFAAMHPNFIQHASVDGTELKFYRLWKETDGGLLD